ncbi:nuclear transport factor 2 family protein [Pseudonocardia kujensis]|uniref:nuclear transport factor 2 family protein n=1 Tax=Pseudonocardia kujensis TaxID=1128675 RepID=UPI001E5EC121|nr:nuclear transport factor 2 family protein [Pseudonocardia kujensis]MCE0767614.1 nuclear transport factor 2 family protein [Pseudonocardia kujensis]
MSGLHVTREFDVPLSSEASARQDVVDAFFADLVDGRVDRCLEICTPDVDMELPFQAPGLTRRCRGVGELRELLEWAVDFFDPFRIARGQVWELVPDGLAVQYRSDCVARATRRTYQNTYLGLFWISEGRIARWLEYCDPLATLVAVGGDKGSAKG